MEHYGVGINRNRARVVIDSSLPHLMALEDDVLSTGIVLYHLKVRRLVPLLSPQPLASEVKEGKELTAMFLGSQTKASELPQGSGPVTGWDLFGFCINGWRKLEISIITGFPLLLMLSCN